jgi:CheY-like chemotaxis protein
MMTQHRPAEGENRGRDKRQSERSAGARRRGRNDGLHAAGGYARRHRLHFGWSCDKVETALKLIEQGGFDIAILDVNLNGDETYPLAEALAARAIPFVFASGYGADGLREKYRRIPSLRKPFQQCELEQILAAVLGRSPGP